MHARSTLDHALHSAAVYERAGDWSLAEASYQEVYRAAVYLRDAATIALVARRRVQLCIHKGHHDEALELAELSEEIAMRTGMMGEAARAANMVGIVHFRMTDITAASAAYENALQRARSAGDDRTVVHASRNQGILCEYAGSLSAARALYLEAIAGSLRDGDPRAAAGIYAHLGSVAGSMQEWMESELYYRRAIELAERSGDVYVQTTATISLVTPLVALGELDEAERILSASGPQAQESQNWTALADIFRMRARVLIARMRPEEAEAMLRDALSITQSHNLTRERAEVLEDIGSLRQLQNRIVLAKSAWREALETFEHLGASGSAARIRQLLES